MVGGIRTRPARTTTIIKGHEGSEDNENNEGDRDDENDKDERCDAGKDEKESEDDDENDDEEDEEEEDEDEDEAGHHKTGNMATASATPRLRPSMGFRTAFRPLPAEPAESQFSRFRPVSQKCFAAIKISL